MIGEDSLLTKRSRAAHVIVVTGTGTDVGKTISVAAIAAAAKNIGLRVGVCKVAQTGVGPEEPGDLTTVTTLAGELTTSEPIRHREPLAPETASRRDGLAPLRLEQVLLAVRELARHSDLIIVEGAGGVLVRLAEDLTIIDVIAALDADGFAPTTLVVTRADLGTLNHTELTVEALTRRGCPVSGLIIGSGPQRPDLATACNREDLPRLTGVSVLAIVPAGAGARSRPEFERGATDWIPAELLSKTFPAPHHRHRHNEGEIQ